MEQKYFLKPNVVIEPLVDNWYAWSHLISPATAAMNIQNRHLRIIDSFIQAPQIHAAAVRNPKMKGGPFMDIDIRKVADVKNLRAQTLEFRKSLLDLAAAINELNSLLQKKAKGYSLEPLYNEIPEMLRGYVELVYDLNQQPSFRFFEALLYKSRFYNSASQSIALWITENDERAFVLSTPRLNSDLALHVNIPFAHPVIDTLSKMKRQPQEVGEVFSALQLKADKRPLFDTLFTKEGPPSYERYEGPSVRMRYFGHACILLETKDVSILLDPVVSYYGYPQDVSRFSDMNLPDQIDYALITHNHQDHVLLETLLPLRHKIKKIVIPATQSGALQDPSLKLMFNNIGFSNVVAMQEMESLSFHDVVITAIPFIGEHSDLNIQTKLCYHVRVGEFTMLFVADSSNVEPKLYDLVHEQVGDIDVMFLGMECDGAPLSWLYGPLLSNDIQRDQDQSRRLAGSNFERGKNLVNSFRPKELYVYAMGQEPWLEFISSIKYTDESNPIVQSNQLINYCKERGIISERLFGEKEILYAKESIKI